nr:restriction endonuclease subunit S [Eubacterium sp.]
MQNKSSSWQKTSLDKIATLYQPQTLSGNDLISNGKYFVYGANGIIGRYNEYNHEQQQIAVACRGASCGVLTMTLPKSWITGNAMVVSPKPEFPYKEYLFYTLSLISIAYLTSGSAQPQLTRDNMSIYPVIIPPIDLLEKFEEKSIIARNIITTNSLENNQLINLRNWLLPMLMNNQVTIID